MDLLDRVLGYDRWTTTQYLEVCRKLTDAQLDQEFEIGLGSLRTTFDHMIFNVGFWTGRMAGEPFTEQRDKESIDRLLERHTRNYDFFERVSRRMYAEGRLDETFTDHHGYLQTQGGTLFHVVVHNAQHRSEILHILRRLGVEDPPEGFPQDWEHLSGFIGELQA